jgi:hypothetical protein
MRFRCRLKSRSQKGVGAGSVLPAPWCKEELRTRDFSQSSEWGCHMNVIALLWSIPVTAQQPVMTIL